MNPSDKVTTTCAMTPTPRLQSLVNRVLLLSPDGLCELGV